MADLAPEEFMRRARAIAVRRGESIPQVAQPSTQPVRNIEAEPPNAINPDAPETGLGQAPAPFEILPQSREQLEQVASSRALSSLGKGEIVEPSKWADPDFATKIGARAGVPFDSASGINWYQRLKMESQPTPEEAVRQLQRAYGKENVRVNSFGDPIVTTIKDGKKVDILADPIGLDLGDTAEFMAALPEQVGALVPLLITRGATLGPGVMKALATLGLSTAGAELAGTAKDMLVRIASGEDVRPKEIAERRSMSGAMNFMVGGGMGVGTKIGTTLISPFSQPGRLQFRARAAQEYFEEKYGIRVPMTAAEATGSPILQRGEALQMAKPGASSPFTKFKAEQTRMLEELQDIATGEVPDIEQSGKKALSALGGKVAPLEFDVEKAAHEVITDAENVLKSGVGTRIDKTLVGNTIDLGAKAKRKAFTDEADRLYGAVYADPLSQAKNIDGDDLANAATALKRRLPSIENTVTTPTGLYTAAGTPIVTTSTQREVLKEFVPAGVLTKLETLQKAKGQPFRLDELIAMRREVDNDIAMGEAIKGVQTRYLTEIRGMLTTRIEDGLKKLSPDLYRKWKTANDWYADNVGQFNQAGIAELFRDPEQASHIGATELVSRATSGKKAQDIYAAYKTFFGAGSPQIRGIQQAVRDDVLQLSTLSETVDANGFIRRLQELELDAPEVLRDAFGPNAKKLKEAAVALGTARGTSFPKEELVKAVTSGTLTAAKLRQLAVAQNVKDEAYRNELVRDIARGSVSAEKIRPTEVVDKLVFRKTTQPEQLDSLMKLINDRPDVQEDLRRLTFKKVLDDATITLRNGEEVVGAKEMSAILDDENMAKRLRSVLGEESFKDLDELRHFLKPGQIMQQAAAGAGSFGASSQIAKIWESGDLPYIGRAIKNFALAAVYLSPSLRKYMTNTKLMAEDKALIVNMVIASAPFARAVTETYTEEAGREIMVQLKNGIDAAVQMGASAGTQDIPWDDFMRRANEIKARKQASQPVLDVGK